MKNIFQNADSRYVKARILYAKANKLYLDDTYTNPIEKYLLDEIIYDDLYVVLDNETLRPFKVAIGDEKSSLSVIQAKGSSLSVVTLESAPKPPPAPQPEQEVQIHVTPVAGGAMIDGKNTNDLQSNIVIDDTKLTIKGTLKYVKGWTQFNSTADLQSGNYLAIEVDGAAEGDTVTVSVEGGTGGSCKPGKLDASKQVVCRITDKGVQKVKIAVTGTKPVTKVYDLTGLTLEPAAGV